MRKRALLIMIFALTMMGCTAQPIKQPTQVAPLPDAGSKVEVPAHATLPPVPSQVQIRPLDDGFYGIPAFNISAVDGDSVHLVSKSVRMTEQGGWEAWGLVQNHLLTDVGQVTVTATLISKSGAIIGCASEEVPVSPLRPGEPGPFHVKAEVQVSDVDSVTWVITTGSAPSNLTRRLRIGMFDPQGIQRAQDGTVLPFRLRTQVTNEEELSDVELVIAFIERATSQVIRIDRFSPDWSKWKRPVSAQGAVAIDVTVMGDETHFGVDSVHKGLQYMAWAVGRTKQ